MPRTRLLAPGQIDATVKWLLGREGQDAALGGGSVEPLEACAPLVRLGGVTGDDPVVAAPIFTGDTVDPRVDLDAAFG